jgi:hypothetical protein
MGCASVDEKVEDAGGSKDWREEREGVGRVAVVAMMDLLLLRLQEEA